VAVGAEMLTIILSKYGENMESERGALFTALLQFLEILKIVFTAACNQQKIIEGSYTFCTHKGQL
jgi:hypothetical protein